MSLRRLTTAIAVAALAAAGLTAASPQAQAATAVPRFDHIVLVMFENKADSQITSSSAPYFTALAAQGANHPTAHRAGPGDDGPHAETRSVDDQAAWLDNQTVMYAVRRGTRSADVWSAPASGAGAAALLIPDAESPAPLA